MRTPVGQVLVISEMLVGWSVLYTFVSYLVNQSPMCVR